jgi:hypothetical protein
MDRSMTIDHSSQGKHPLSFPGVKSQDILKLSVFSFAFAINGVSDSLVVLSFVSFYLEDEANVSLDMVGAYLSVFVMLWWLGSTVKNVGGKIKIMFIVSGLTGVLLFYLPFSGNIYIAIGILGLKAFLQ